MKISERIDALRREMLREGIDIYLVPTADYHHSEYVGEYFKARQFLTGFTGSAGTALFTAEKAGLWTDGRYFIQAEKELKGTGVVLYKMGEPGVDTIEEFLEKELPEGGTLGFDGRTVGLGEGRKYEKIVRKKNGRLICQHDLAGCVWKDRPPISREKAFLLDTRWSGESTASKLARVREKIAEEHADVQVLSSLDDIAWMLNIRGNDVAYCPLVLAYALIYKERVELFADREKFSDEIMDSFRENRVAVRPYDGIYEAVRGFGEGDRVLLDPESTSYALYSNIPAGAEIVEAQNPQILMKSRKNDTEADNLRKAHLKDGTAHTRFMYWLKKNAGKIPMTERSAAAKLEEFRAQQEGYLGASFEHISAFGEHGAIVHYSASPETDAELQEGKLLLTDTGGHYWEGSTDITRTVALGSVSREEKEHFTIVARAMLRLANTVFLHGCTGANLDCIAREVFWKERLNFNHGTGHGVGYLMNIHEAPINFRWREGRTPAPVLEKNMVITDEPGVYIEDSHGIRLENELLVQEDEKNQYGQFMHFEILTFVPIDLDAVLPELMSVEERAMLNAYHAKVYELIGPRLPEEERKWLREYTRPV
ncbi:MAG TPA: aminopeptidase P family protein [Candidatus Mediterraneibacter caccogallinarum]|nr:aminopeptidase P family protein [Candidatus Mediterraneibacter caccogallinarum]